MQQQQGGGGNEMNASQAQAEDVAPQVVRWQRQAPTLPTPPELRVLVVEKHAASRHHLVQLLRECSYHQVDCAKTSSRALQLLQTQDAGPRYHLVLKAHDPPQTAATRLLRKLSQLPSNMAVPVVVVSSNDDREMVMKCLTLGAIDYLIKPLRHNELRHIWTRVWLWRRSLAAAPSACKPETIQNSESAESGSSGVETKCDEQEEEEPTSNEGSAPGHGNSGNSDSGHNAGSNGEGNGASRVEAHGGDPGGDGPTVGNGSSGLNGNGNSATKHRGSIDNGGSATPAERNALVNTAEGKAPPNVEMQKPTVRSFRPYNPDTTTGLAGHKRFSTLLQPLSVGSRRIGDASDASPVRAAAGAAAAVASAAGLAVSGNPAAAATGTGTGTGTNHSTHDMSEDTVYSAGRNNHANSAPVAASAGAAAADAAPTAGTGSYAAASVATGLVTGVSKSAAVGACASAAATAGFGVGHVHGLPHAVVHPHAHHAPIRSPRHHDALRRSNLGSGAAGSTAHEAVAAPGVGAGANSAAGAAGAGVSGFDSSGSGARPGAGTRPAAGPGSRTLGSAPAGPQSPSGHKGAATGTARQLPSQGQAGCMASGPGASAGAPGMSPLMGSASVGSDGGMGGAGGTGASSGGSLWGQTSAGLMQLPGSFHQQQGASSGMYPGAIPMYPYAASMLGLPPHALQQLNPQALQAMLSGMALGQRQDQGAAGAADAAAMATAAAAAGRDAMYNMQQGVLALQQQQQQQQQEAAQQQYKMMTMPYMSAADAMHLQHGQASAAAQAPGHTAAAQYHQALMSQHPHHSMYAFNPLAGQMMSMQMGGARPSHIHPHQHQHHHQHHQHQHQHQHRLDDHKEPSMPMPAMGVGSGAHQAGLVRQHSAAPSELQQAATQHHTAMGMWGGSRPVAGGLKAEAPADGTQAAAAAAVAAAYGYAQMPGFGPVVMLGPGDFQGPPPMEKEAVAVDGSDATPGQQLLAGSLGAMPTAQMLPFLQQQQQQQMPRMSVGGSDPSKRRAQALERYRSKRQRLTFGKVIRYESRKQLAQQRPRVRGQFVKRGSSAGATGADAMDDAGLHSPAATAHGCSGESVQATEDADEGEVTSRSTSLGRSPQGGRADPRETKGPARGSPAARGR